MKFLSKINSSIIERVIFYILAIIIISAGIYWRTKAYLNAYPLWADEVSLVLSILKKNVLGLFSNLLDNQKAPPLFMVISYIFTKIGGYNVLSYRFFAFLSSIFSLFLFFLLSLKLYKSRIPVLIGLYIFSVCEPLIYYAREFKPYSTDVFVCLLLILICTPPHLNLRKISIRQCIFYSALSIFFILLSFPSIYIISAILLFKVIENKTLNGKTLIIAGSIICSCLYLYLLYNELRISCEILAEEWKRGFLTFSFNSIHNIISNFINFLIGGINELQISFIIIFIITGVILFLIERNKYAILMLIIFAFACIGSYYKIYPLTGRIILYFTPVLIFFLVKPLDFCTAKFSNIIKSVLLSIILLYFLNMLNINSSYLFLPNPEAIEMRTSIERRIDIKNVIKNILKKHKQTEEVIGEAEQMLYAEYYGIELYNKKLERIDFPSEKANTTLFENLKNNKNFWFLTNLERYTIDDLLENKEIKDLYIKNNYKFDENCKKQICSYYIYSER